MMYGSKMKKNVDRETKLLWQISEAKASCLGRLLEL
jgi:hypothetical protein